MNSKVTQAINDPVIRASLLFEGLSEDELHTVARFLKPCSVFNGDVIFEEGAGGEEMFILLSGKSTAWMSHADGTRQILFEFGPGDFFGEMSIIANEARSATLIANEDSELLGLNAIDFDQILKEYPIIGTKMLKAIRKVQNTWLEKTSRLLADLMRWGETARRRAVMDELTGLYNRRFLEESAHSRFQHNTVGIRNISLLMMDLDRIHTINERYGRHSGDLVFLSVADILHSVTRKADISARLSGDEFAVLLPDTDTDEALGIAERIRQITGTKKILVSKTPDSGEKTEIIVNTSIGLATAPKHADSWENLVLIADKALRQAKELGRNRVVVASRE